MKKIAFLACLGLGGLAATGTQAATLDNVRERGTVACGVEADLVGFAAKATSGDWEGFDVAICRAVAAATLADPRAVEFVPLSPQTWFDALTSGRADVLIGTTAWTFSDDVDPGVEFAGVAFYDGQGFLVKKELGVSSATELNKLSVCVQAETTTAEDVAAFFAAHGVDYQPVDIAGPAEAQAAYLDGTCSVYAANVSVLAATRAKLVTPGDHVILPEILSKDPLGPFVRRDDEQWASIVRWTLNAMVAAEELGVTSANVEELGNGSDNKEINRLLGVEGNLGERLGLPVNWARNIVAMVGNYGEVFEANVGEYTPIGLARGLNAQWKDGGLLYAPPFR